MTGIQRLQWIDVYKRQVLTVPVVENEVLSFSSQVEEYLVLTVHTVGEIWLVIERVFEALSDEDVSETELQDKLSVS